MKTKFFCTLILFGLLSACSNSEKSATEKTQDSVEHIEMEKVDQMLENEDSILKAKEAELLKQYGN